MTLYKKVVKMDKKAVSRIKYILLASIFIVGIAFMFLGIAAHDVATSDGGTSYSVNEGVGFIYNISINNTDEGAGDIANITEVNITLPQNFTFFVDVNGTDAVDVDFTNTSTVLSWSNLTGGYVINGSNTTRHFWFNATVSFPGNYNITVLTLNSTDVLSSNITVTVNDTTAPLLLDFIAPTISNVANLSQTSIPVNVSILDAYSNIDTVHIYLYNTTDLVNNTNQSATVATNGTSYINFTGLADGRYFVNVTANDSAGNQNTTGTSRTVTLDTTPPTITQGSAATTTGNYSQNWIFINVTSSDAIVGLDSMNVTLYNESWDANSSTFAAGSSNVTLNVTGLSDGTYYLNVTANDTLNNINTSIQTIILDTTEPYLLDFMAPTVANLANLSQRSIPVNVSVNDTSSNIDSVQIYLYNVSGLVNNTNVTANGDLNATAYINFTAPADGIYYINVTANDSAGNLNSTGISRTVTLDTTAPTISFADPTPSNNSVVGGTLQINVSIADGGTGLETVTINVHNSTDLVNSSSDSSGGASYNFNFTGLTGGMTYLVNATVNDSLGNINSTGTRTYIFADSTFEFNGTLLDVNGNRLDNNSLVNVTIRNMNGFTVVGYVSANSNGSGWFNMSIPSDNAWMYEPKITWSNASTGAVEYIGQSLPSFPAEMIQQVAGTTFYLKEAGTINITAINSTGDRIPFEYQIKDQKLGYSIAAQFGSHVSEAIITVQRDRNYSLMIYPNVSMPVSFDWNNFSATTSYDVSDISNYNHTTKALHYQFNTTMTMKRVSGYFNYSGISGWDEFIIIPYLLEPGNMVQVEYGMLPKNMSAATNTTDIYDLSTGFYNITLPGTVETSSVILFVSAVNDSQNIGAVKNISLSTSSAAETTDFNFTGGAGLFGSLSNVTPASLGAPPTNITLSKQTFNIVNASNHTMSNVNGHIEVTVDYSSIGAIEFTWMTGISQGSVSTFLVPLLNNTGVKEINAFIGGGDYAPVRKSYTSSQITDVINITLNAFNPGAIDSVLAASAITMGLYISNSSCDVPNPASACVVGSSSSMEDFNPMSAIIGGGKLSFRMGTGNISVHYANVDMLASGPPDALFDSAASTDTSGSFESALRFGSGGPTIYDYILISLPYTEGSSSQTGLNESADVNMSIPLFYDESWNIIWNSTANGTDAGALAGNNSHYSTAQGDWANLMNTSTCTTNVTIFNATTPCYINTTNNRVWVRLPHFSGTGPKITGSVITATAAAAADTPSSSGSGSVTPSFWTSTVYDDNEELSKRVPVVRALGEGHRVILKVNNEKHEVGVVKVNGNSVTINVSSTPQQATLSLRESKKFDVDSNGYYDIKVTLNSILDNKANLTIEAINEKVPVSEKTLAEEGEEDKAVSDNLGSEGGAAEGASGDSAKESSNAWVWIVLVLIIVLIIVAVFLIKQRHGNLKRVGLR